MIETRVSLLERVRDPSNAAAWSEFVTTYEPLLTAYVRKRGVPPEDAADIVQMVLTRLITALAKFHLDHERGRFRSWLWQITHSTLTDWHRRHAVRARAEQEWGEQQEQFASAQPDEDWDRLYRQRVLEVVLKSVSETAQPASWACFKGRVLEDRPAADIAAELGISVNAVYINASRLLARVREACAEYAESLREE
jgi:RNA polymerase sigma-70 factor (ECF subfamily)